METYGKIGRRMTRDKVELFKLAGTWMVSSKRKRQFREPHMRKKILGSSTTILRVDRG